MAKYVAAIDQGTSSTRFMLFDHSGQITALDQKEHQQFYPQSGWVEHDPMEIWIRTQEVILNTLQKSGIHPSEIVALGITNQRETTVIWDKTNGQPLYPAIVWQDTRTDAICNTLAKEGGQDRLREKTGLPLATYFSGPKIKWLIENIPRVSEAVQNGTAMAGTIDSWLIWNLTGGKNGGLHITDGSNASRTLLMDLQTHAWDDGLLNLMGVPAEILPEIQPSSHVFGEARGILEGVPIAGLLGDQQAALFGQTCFNPGEAKNTYGTGCFMLMNTGTQPIASKNGLLTTFGYQIENQPPIFCLEGSIAISGALVQWLRDNLGIISKSSEIETLAYSVEDNGGMYFVPAFSGLFAPYWRSDARGVIVGLTRFVNRGHFARAALEATAYQTREVLEAMKSDSGIDLQSLKVDGGMVVNNLLMQFQADMVNVPVTRPKVAETTSLGAAYAAGLAVGFWHSQDELRANWAVDKTWIPSMEPNQRDRLFTGWKKAVSRSLDWTN
ncbi:MAG TPA: glycerol kinase GlpK [Leptolinea sp.]